MTTSANSRAWARAALAASVASAIPVSSWDATVPAGIATGPAQHVEPRREGRQALGLPARPGAHDGPDDAGLVGERLGERGLADARLTGEQEQPAPPTLGVSEGRGADRKQALPTDEHDPTLLTTGRTRRPPRVGDPLVLLVVPLGLAVALAVALAGLALVLGVVGFVGLVIVAVVGLSAVSRSGPPRTRPGRARGRSASCRGRPWTRRRRGCPSGALVRGFVVGVLGLVGLGLGAFVLVFVFDGVVTGRLVVAVPARDGDLEAGVLLGGGEALSVAAAGS